MTDRLLREMQRQLAEAEAEKQADDDAKYRPTDITKPGGQVEFTVELPDNASLDEVSAAMQSAIRKLGRSI